MPVLTLEFNLPDEQHEADCAYKGLLLRSAAEGFQEDLRQRLKHTVMTEDQMTELVFVRDLFYGHFGELM